MRWVVSLSGENGADTLKVQRLREQSEQEAEMKKVPLVRAVFDCFPEAKIIDVRPGTSDVTTKHAKEP